MMRFEADLDLEVDGARAHVRGDGATLVVETDDPVALIGGVGRVAGPRRRQQLAAVADRLAANGASVRVEGPHGHLVTVGADADNRVLGLLAGSRHLAPGWRAITSSVTGGARAWPRLGAVIAALAGALLIIARARRAGDVRRP